MKKWLISYSIRYYQRPEPVEYSATLHADTIGQALELVRANIKEPMEMDPSVDKVVIWHIGIVDENVF